MSRLAAPTLFALALLSSIASAGTVEGRVGVGVRGLDLASVAPVIVFLAPEDDATPLRTEGLPPVTITQRNARFEPGFAVVVVGQRLEMPNFDGFFHNVFSFSRPNDFDLGVYASGEARSIVFEHAGLVRLYCSIHESMSGLVLVVPSKAWSRVETDGRFSIPRIPPGRYRITAWSEQLPPITTSIAVGNDPGPSLELLLGATKP
jgi:plastocyanin